MQFTFNPLFKEISSVDGFATIDELSDEQMLFGAGWIFARENGGSLTNRIMDKILTETKKYRFSTR